MKVLITVLCVFAVASARVGSRQLTLPSFVRLCSISDPSRDLCLKNSIQSLLPQVKNNPSFFIPMDPYFQDSATHRVQNVFVDGVFTLKNMKIFGMSNALVKNVKSQFNDFGMKLELDLFMPKLVASGFYKTDLLLTGAKVLSKGQFNVTLSNVNTKWTMKGKLVNIKGVKFLEIYDTDIELDVGDAKTSLSGVFQDPTLNDLVNTFVNRYWRLVYKGVFAETKVQWSPVVLDIINQFFSQYPFENLVLP